VYISNQDKNQIEVVRTKDDAILVPIPTTKIYPKGIGISPDGAYLFVGQSSGLESVVDMLRLSDNTVVSSAKIPGNARDIAISRNSSRIFVTEYNNDRCYAFDVVGESLTLSAVANLDTEPGLRAAPIGLAILESLAAPNRSQVELLEPKADGQSAKEKGKSTPAPGILATVAAVVLVTVWMRRKSDPGDKN
jgi:DNA-binding beta-propeller fold protein YncE